jgi:hypothetical protein
MNTRRITISSRKVAYQGSRYTDQFLGLTAVEKTWEGENFVGTVTGFDGEYAILTAPDGRWMRTASRDLHVAT